MIYYVKLTVFWERKVVKNIKKTLKTQILYVPKTQKRLKPNKLLLSALLVTASSFVWTLAASVNSVKKGYA